MKKRIFNPYTAPDAKVDMVILGARVIVEPGGEELVEKNVGEAMQEIQPQLHYSDVAEVPKKKRKRAKPRLKAKLKVKIEKAKKLIKKKK